MKKMGKKNIFRSLSLSRHFLFRVGSGGSGRLRVATQRGMAMHSRAHVMMVFGLSTSRSS